MFGGELSWMQSEIWLEGGGDDWVTERKRPLGKGDNGM